MDKKVKIEAYYNVYTGNFQWGIPNEGLTRGWIRVPSEDKEIVISI